MKAPRYLLRECAIKQLLKERRPGKFLEIGYGNGNLLLTLSKLGYYGDGYDFSDEARRCTSKLLARHGVSSVRLLSSMEEKGSYDYIFMLEVLGYFEDPKKELHLLRQFLKKNGQLIVSVVKKGSSYSSMLLGNQYFFSRDEINTLLLRAGFRVMVIWNYGYPLANILSPLLSASLRMRGCGLKNDPRNILEVRQTGLVHEHVFMKMVSFLVNSITIYPFAQVQSFFKNTDFGNGYIIIAQKIE